MIYHFSAKIHKRKDGASAIGKAAYRAGERLYDERTGITHDYTGKGGVVFQRIYAPTQAPVWATDRAKLWNAVEQKERRGDAQLCREYEIGLVNELDLSTNVKLLDALLAEAVADGMIADVSVHDPRKAPRNLHAHVLLTMRDIGPDGFGNKNRAWNPEFGKSKKGASFVADKSPLVNLRERWAQTVNAELKRRQISKRIDHRSYKAQGTDKIPQPKVGPRAVKWGKESRLIEQRRLAQEHNQIIDMQERLQRDLDRSRPQISPGRNCKQDYKRKLVEHHYQAAISRDLVPQICHVDLRAIEPIITLKSGAWIKDQGDLIAARWTDEDAVRLMFDLAQAKGWESVTVRGGAEFIALALAEAKQRGIPFEAIDTQGDGAPIGWRPDRIKGEAGATPDRDFDDDSGPRM